MTSGGNVNFFLKESSIKVSTLRRKNFVISRQYIGTNTQYVDFQGVVSETH